LGIFPHEIGEKNVWIQYTGRRVGRNLALGERLKKKKVFSPGEK
jgi:hypothetical protein